MTSQGDRDDYSTRLLEALFTKQHRHLQPLASLILGISGVAILAIGISSVAGEMIALSRDLQSWEWMDTTLSLSFALLGFAVVYPVVVMTMQLLATCRMPFSLRLFLAIGLLWAALQSLGLGPHWEVGRDSLIPLLPICFGGFLQQSRNGWYAIAWGQTIKPPGQLSIANLLDWTAAFAIAIAICSTLDIRLGELLVMIPVFLLMMAGGMHGWGRLTALCDRNDKEIDREIGVAMWVIGNTVFACFVFGFIAFSGDRTPSVLIALFVAPATVLVAQLVTAVPIAWLKACGWKLVRT